MFVACVQSDVSFADPASNLQRMIQWMQQAASADAPSPAELIVFPECMLTGYNFDARQQAMDAALAMDDPIFSELTRTASLLNQTIVFGFLRRSDQHLYNASAVIDGSGIQSIYHKIHLPFLGADRFVDRGQIPYQALAASDRRGQPYRLGMAICYDASFPEPIRVLGLQGVDIIALPTNWPMVAARVSEVIPPTRSIENHVYFLTANRVGQENGIRFCGRSSICNPHGECLAQSNDERECLLIAEIDPALPRQKHLRREPGTHEIDRFSDRRPEFYTSLVKPINQPK